MADTRRVGKLGEEAARLALTRRGYQIVEANWRCPLGEIDIVARDGECWAFVEVKTRRGARAGLPEEALTPHKAERLAALAEYYLYEHHLGEVNWRIDLVAIDLDAHDGVRRLNVVPGVAAD